MSFGSTAGAIPKQKKLAGLDPTKVNSTQRAQPVPYFAGKSKLGVTWLGKALRQKAKKVDDGGGKGAGAGSSHKYYADLAALICHGPVDALLEVWMDDYRVWQGNVTRGAEDSASITIEDRGVVTIYWGTETQGIDSLLAAAGHTAYRGQCYAVFNQLCLGTDTTNAPNVQFVLARYPATNIGALTQSSRIGDSANAVHCVVEVLSNQRYGAAFDPATTIDLAKCNATAVQLAAEGLGLSPQLIDQASAREVITKFCEYFDGWVESFDDDLLRIQLTRSNPAAAEDLPLLGEYDLLDVPEITPQGWRDTYNQVSVSFTNSGEGFQDDSVTWYDQANLAFSGAPRISSLERAWIDNATLANQIAAYYGRLYSVPHLTAKLTFRKEAVAAIKIGDFIRLTYRDFNETVIFRITARGVDRDRSQAVTLEVEADRYFADILAYTPEHAPAGDVLPIEPDPVLFGRAIELPFDLVPTGRNRNHPQLAAVAARASALDVKLRVFSSEDALTYDRLAATRDFALYGTLAADYPADTLLLDDGAAGILLNVPGPDDEFPSTSAGAWLKSRLLLFVDDEILSYRAAVVVSTNQVRLLGIRRACSDTLAAAHVVGARVLAIHRRELCIFTDETYAAGVEIDVKLATATRMGTIDLSALDPISLTLTNRTARPMPPMNLRVNGSGNAPTFAAGADVLIEWDHTNWRRHGFFANWDEALVDDKITHKLKMFTTAGAVVHRAVAAAGVSSYVYAAADLAADFGTATPAGFRVVVFSRRRGMRSLGAAEITVTLAP